MQTRDFEVSTPDGPMTVYETVPEAAPHAAVIVIQEAFGVNDHIQDVTRRVAGAGYHAVAPHLFHRAGGGTVPYGDFSQVLPMFKDLDDGKILADVDATRGALHERGFEDARTGIVGFCFGGRVSFLAAVRRALGAAVTFYGGGIVTARFPQFPPLVGEAPNLRAPWLGLFGDEDGSIPVDDVERLRAELAPAAPDHDIVRYPDAGHGFHCDQRPGYVPAAAKDAWQRTLDWFGRHLG